MISINRSRFRAGFAAAALAILAIAPSALADTTYWSSGKIGKYDVIDTGKKPGAWCTSNSGVGLAIQAREPRVFAQDRTAGEDRQKVGWQVIVERKEPGKGWAPALYSTIVTASATDRTPADFPGTLAFFTLGGTFRVVDTLMWYGADGTTVRGAIDSRVTFYKQKIDGTTVVAYKNCAG